MATSTPSEHHREFAEADELLSSISQAFASIAGDPYEEERWRWDVPAVVFSWCSGGLRRNLTARLDDATDPKRIYIGGNAWTDPKHGEDNRRHWKCLEETEVRLLALKFDNRLSNCLRSSKAAVEKWSRDDLEPGPLLADATAEGSELSNRDT